jgi:hypothetical protein
MKKRQDKRGWSGGKLFIMRSYMLIVSRNNIDYGSKVVD